MSGCAIQLEVIDLGTQGAEASVEVWCMTHGVMLAETNQTLLFTDLLDAVERHRAPYRNTEESL